MGRGVGAYFPAREFSISAKYATTDVTENSNLAHSFEFGLAPSEFESKKNQILSKFERVGREDNSKKIKFE